MILLLENLNFRDCFPKETKMDSEKLFDLSGKLALITGASRGIGAEAAKTLARFGARVILSSRKREGLMGLPRKLRRKVSRQRYGPVITEIFLR